MKHILLAVFMIMVASADAAPREYSVRVGGVERTYLLYVPSKRPSGQWPLVVLMHGGGGNGRQAMSAYRMNEVADRHGFLVAYPNGSGRRERLLTWNAGNCCGHAMEVGVDDVQFIRAMVEAIDRQFDLDRSRLFATGMSNGAMMAYRLGCEAADVFAAIAPVAGALNISCRPSDAVSVMIVHGTDDEHVPYEGGRGTKSYELRVDKPVLHAVEVWREVNRCSRDSGSQRRGNIERRSWSGGRDGTDVTLVTIHGGGHAWPGGVRPRREIADVPTQEISASDEIWKFFAAHPKR